MGLLVPQESDDRFVAVDLPSGRILASVPVGRQPHDSIQVGPDTVFVADELADTIHIVRDGVVTKVVGAPIQPGGMASSPDGSVMVTVAVRGRRITAYRNDGSIIGSANCGAGPTHAVTGAGGLYWVVDTNGGAILGFKVDGQGPRQVARIPVGAKPYGIAHDDSRSTLWITLTPTNQLVGLHLKGTSITSRTRRAEELDPCPTAGRLPPLRHSRRTRRSQRDLGARHGLHQPALGPAEAGLQATTAPRSPTVRPSSHPLSANPRPPGQHGALSISAANGHGRRPSREPLPPGPGAHQPARTPGADQDPRTCQAPCQHRLQPPLPAGGST